MTDLSAKAISIHGKSYVLVKDRVSAFNEMYPNGSITTELISNQNGRVVIKATVVPDVKNPERTFSDYSQEDEKKGAINATSAMENCSTSAVGRALAMMGIGVIDSIASADEMVKAQAQEEPGDDGFIREAAEEATCEHASFKYAQSHTPKNPNRWFKSCVTCQKFLGWDDNYEKN